MVLTARSDVYFCAPLSEQLITQHTDFHQISYTRCTIRREPHLPVACGILNARFLLWPEYSLI
jgi:hypothetical protein